MELRQCNSDGLLYEVQMNYNSAQLLAGTNVLICRKKQTPPRTVLVLS